MAPRSLNLRRLRIAVPLVALAALLAPAHAAGGEPTGAGSAWVWSWGEPGQGAEEAAAGLADRVEAEGLDRVALNVQAGFDRRAEAAIAALGARGVAVEALAGERDWGSRGRADMLAFVRAARAYDRAAPEGSRLAGIHLDVEPWGMGRWERDGARLLRDYLESISRARRVAGPLALTIDIPLAFESTPSPRGSRERNAAAEAIRRADAAVLMDYRDDAGRAIVDGRREIRIGARLGREVWIGLETAPAVGEPESITFFEEGRAALADAIAAIAGRFGGSEAFGGVVVHHLGSLSGLDP
ncbi:hypothetical protein HJD18_02305 [Thermoleophilia bacterium SCSIO 60948]|nr:hypothetical protein HJD18_02305 [Thermoleophilia bacterium SCSIO 60948]